MLINRKLVLLVLICLLYDALDHFDTFGKVFVRVGGNKYVQRFILINLFFIVDAILYRNVEITERDHLPCSGCHGHGSESCIGSPSRVFAECFRSGL